MFDLGRAFIAAVERAPDALAIVDGDQRLSYADWYAHIRRLVGGLDSLGLEPGAHLVAALQHNLEMVSLHWACQFAGVIFTPVNWRADADELDYVIEDAGAQALVFQDVSADAVAAAKAAGPLPRIAVRGADGGTHDVDALMRAPPADVRPRAGPEDISVMLYTSGTIGRGKGVPRRHRVQRASANAHIAQSHFSFGERTLGVMPLYHTMGVHTLITMAALNGCYVCLPRFDPGRALELIEAERISALFLVPTLYYDLVSHPAFGETDVASVDKLGFAGAPMTEGLLQRCEATFQPAIFFNHYGASEIFTFTVERHAVAKPGSAGKAGLNQVIRVIRLGSSDPEDRCRADEEGQVIASLASDEAFDGYHRRPDADAKALNGGWYFTGDVGHLDADDDLFVTGRVDDMIHNRRRERAAR